MVFDTNIEFARKMDEADELKPFRERFYFPNPQLIYLDGNSLGPLLLNASDAIADLTHEQWGRKLIESWNEHWYNLPEKLGNLLAPIIGASADEVIVCDSTSVNLYKLAHAALKLRPGRTKVVSDVMNFPTDLYILQGILKEAGNDYTLELAGTKDNIYPDLEDLHSKIDENTALVVLSHVAFKSGYMYNMKEVTWAAHKNGALIIWDLSHSAGAVPVEMNASGADMAVGCTYKYLNGGPGSPAYLYVKKELQPLLHSPIQGWFGDNNPFGFELQYKPALNIKKFMAGTPPVLSMAAIQPGIEIALEAGIDKLRQKSIAQTSYLLFLVEQILSPLGFASGSPEDPMHRGSHIAIRHTEAYRICQALIKPESSQVQIIPDFREPDIIRLGVTPLYTKFTDIHNAVLRIKEIVTSKEYALFSLSRNKVT